MWYKQIKFEQERANSIYPREQCEGLKISPFLFAKDFFLPPSLPLPLPTH